MRKLCCAVKPMLLLYTAAIRLSYLIVVGRQPVPANVSLQNTSQAPSHLLFLFSRLSRTLCWSIRFCSDECRRVVLPRFIPPSPSGAGPTPFIPFGRTDRETFKRWPTAPTQRSYQFRTRTRQPSTSRFSYIV